MEVAALKNKDLLEYREIERWLTGSPYSTKANYLSSLKKYLRYRDMDPEELIDEIEMDRKKSMREQGEVELEVKKFLEWLRTDREKQTGGYRPKKTGEKGMSDKAISSILGAIRSFYRANGFTLNVETPKAVPKKKNRKKPLRADSIKKLVDHAPTLRDKAIILMMFQSGMDVSTLCSLDYGDVAEGLQTGEEPLPIHVVREKAHVDYVTFLGKDGIDALKAYLNKRRKKEGEIAYSDPLFLKHKYGWNEICENCKAEWNGGDTCQQCGSETSERIVAHKYRIAPDLIQKMMRQVAVLSGVVSKERMEQADMNPCRPHALRAAFSSVLKGQGVPYEVVEYWMGHTVPYDAAYSNYTPGEMQEMYAEHSDALSINRATEQVKKLSKEMREHIGELQMENRRLQKKLDSMEQSKEQEMGQLMIKTIRDNPEFQKELLGELKKLDKD